MIECYDDASRALSGFEAVVKCGAVAGPSAWLSRADADRCRIDGTPRAPTKSQHLASNLHKRFFSTYTAALYHFDPNPTS